MTPEVKSHPIEAYCSLLMRVRCRACGHKLVVDGCKPLDSRRRPANHAGLTLRQVIRTRDGLPLCSIGNVKRQLARRSRRRGGCRWRSYSIGHRSGHGKDGRRATLIDIGVGVSRAGITPTGAAKTVRDTRHDRRSLSPGTLLQACAAAPDMGRIVQREPTSR